MIDFPDAASYARYVKGGGTLAKDDWRRHNVDLLVEALYKGVHATKPWVKFGVSPFGIWRPGNPATITARFDAYQELYADSKTWLRNGWVDYWTPQLYWAIAGPQSYPELLNWWAEQNVKGRHLWIGNGLHRVGDTNIVGASGNRALGWRADEIVDQVKLTRTSSTLAAHGGATGNVFFSMKGLMRDVDSIGAKLGAVYTEPALVPASPWLDRTPPGTPVIALYSDSATGESHVRLTPAKGEKTWLWVVRVHTGDAWITYVLPGWIRDKLIANAPDRFTEVRVTAVDRTGNESRPAQIRPARD
jgi:uncharacterized lipoprotein YddW (UPF0748 family)